MDLDDDELKATKYNTMSEEEKALTNIKEFIENDEIKSISVFDLHRVLNLIEKQNKVIDLIARSWKQDDIRSVEEIKEYFYKKAEEDNE